MEKMIQATFTSEVEAFKGLQALQQLDLTKDISLGETYVLTKDKGGNTSIRSAKDKAEGTGTIGGGLLGGLIGLLAGPFGFVVGVAGGLIAGSAGETLHAENVSDYLDMVSKNIPDGQSVLIAHLWEDWETPVDSVLLPLTKDLRRFNVHDEAFAPVLTELDKVNTDIDEAEARLLEANKSEKAEWDATLSHLRKKRETLQKKLGADMDRQEKQYQDWIDHSHEGETEYDKERHERLKNRTVEQKAKLEQLKKDKVLKSK